MAKTRERRIKTPAYTIPSGEEIPIGPWIKVDDFTQKDVKAIMKSAGEPSDRPKIVRNNRNWERGVLLRITKVG